jgi:2'-5' RNA ligase
MPSDSAIILSSTAADIISTTSAEEMASHTTACRADNFVSWHLGRPFYAVWIVEADTAEMRAHISAMRRHLGDWLLPDYRRQPHITLAVCGFPQAHATDAHSYTEADFHRDIAGLQTSSPASLQLSTGTADSFTTAAYLGLKGDIEPLHAMRARLRAAETQPYVPHITAGFYRRRLPMNDVQQKLAALALPEISLEINTITLAVYASAEIAGGLFPVCRYHLHENQLQMVKSGYLPWRIQATA